MENFETTGLGPDPKVMRNGAPSPAYVGATWAAMVVGFAAFVIGLFNADMMLNEKGYYFCVLMFGLFSAVAVQKSVRDSLEGIPVSNIFYGISWICAAAAIVMLVIGLWNADLALSEKGFYGMAFALSMFAAMTVQKNVRDNMAAKRRVFEDSTKEANSKL